MLHEFVPPDPAEDVTLAATTLDGDLPAALDTPSGLATAPDPTRAPDAKNLYSGGTSDDGPESTYEPDRDTRQPEVENYEDPFSPSTSPFKRLRAYDTVDADYTLRVADKTLSLITVGGDIRDTDEPFYADFSIDLVPDEPVRIPTVGPGSRVLKLHTNPDANVTIVHDGAENWFMRSHEKKRVRVVMELAIQRSTFGSDMREVSWAELQPFVPPQPKLHHAAAEKVLEKIGVSRSMSVPAAVAKMVAYFREFEPSDNIPKENGDIYLDLALSKKGVCRHRAFAFFVTALELGLPARMVVNEAHAWVEVFDGKLWHRVDLGGAALNLDNQPDPTKPQYQPPQDPYAWPDAAQQNSGQGLATRTRQQAGLGTSANPNGNDPNGSSTTPNDPNHSRHSDLPASKVELESAEKTVRRGSPLKVKGKIEGCRNVRVDVSLRTPGRASSVPVGALSTDDSGVYEGVVIIPRDASTGDYDLVISTPGDAQCGPGTTSE